LAGGQTMAFIVLALSQVLQSYNMRSERSLFEIGIFTNKNLNNAALVSFLLVLLVIFTPLRIAFGLVILPFHLYVFALVLVLIPTIIMEASKRIGVIKQK